MGAVSMPKIIKIKPHLSWEELDTGYGKAKEPVKRTHYKIIHNFESLDEVPVPHYDSEKMLKFFSACKIN